MTKLKKMLVYMLTFIMLISFTACTKDPIIDPNVEDFDNLYLFILNRGYGTQWLYRMAEAFEEETGINTEVTASSTEERLTTEISKGPFSTAKTGLFFDLSHLRARKNSVTGLWKDYPEGLLDMTDLYDMEIEGEGITLGEKMNSSIKQYSNFGTEDAPKYFTVPWASGIMGMTYNIDVLTELYGDTYKNKLPRTTDELVEFAKEIKEKGATPFVFPGQLDYFSSSMFSVWWAQYSGVEEYENFYNGLVYNEIYDSYMPSKDIFRQTGRLKSIEVLHELMNREAGLFYLDGYAYGKQDFQDLQEKYLIKSNKIAMMPNGDWLESESANADSCKFGMLKSPVISSIRERLTSIDSDEKLAETVDFVDGVTSTAPAGVLPEHIEQVRIARKMVYTYGLNHPVYAPEYTNTKTNAYKFLLFMASDKGMKIYKENVAGGFLPFDYDYSSLNLSPFESDVSKILSDFVYAGELNLSPVFYKGGVRGVYYSDGTYLDPKLSAPLSSNTYKNAQQAYEHYFYTDSQWELVANYA